MTDDRELMQMALDALANIPQAAVDVMGGEKFIACCIAIEALRARLAQPDPEPVAWLTDDEAVYFDEVEAIKCSCDTVKPLYTTPPQREWQGLTDEEVLSVMESAKDFQGRIAMTWVNHENQTYVTDVGNRIARAIEQTLREKNT